MKWYYILICVVVILLILAVIQDFVVSRKRNRDKFGSDFLFDAIQKGSQTQKKNMGQQNKQDKIKSAKKRKTDLIRSMKRERDSFN